MSVDCQIFTLWPPFSSWVDVSFESILGDSISFHSPASKRDLMVTNSSHPSICEQTAIHPISFEGYYKCRTNSMGFAFMTYKTTGEALMFDNKMKGLTEVYILLIKCWTGVIGSSFSWSWYKDSSKIRTKISMKSRNCHSPTIPRSFSLSLFLPPCLPCLASNSKFPNG